MSDWLRRNQWVYVVVFIAAAVALWRATRGDEEHPNSDVISDQTWYYDVTAGELFRAPRDQVPPIRTPDGHEAVWASVYGCGGCGASQRFVGFMVKHTDELKARAEADPGVKGSLFGESCKGRLYSVDGKTWIAASNPAEAGVLDSFRTRCGNGDLRRCP